MKLRYIIASALALGLSMSAALAQTNPGASPLTGSKGGTNNAFMQFTGPATSIKTFTLPNASDTIATLAAIQTFSAAKTFNSATLLLAGSSSGVGTLNAPAAASSYVWTLPAATGGLMVGPTSAVSSSIAVFNGTSGAVIGDGNRFLPSGVIVGTTDTQTLTNKTLDAPTLTTPSLGVATATSINKVTITAPATSATLTIPDGVTLTGPASSGTAMTLGNAETVTGAKSFNDATVILKGATSGTTTLKSGATAGTSVVTLPVATDTLVGKATTDTLTNKTFDTAGTGNSLSINGLAATANTGTGAVVRAASAALTGTTDVQEAVTLSGDISPTQLAANTNDWAPTGFSTASTVRLSTDASRNITGLAGGADGRVIILHNIGSFSAVLTNEDALSTAGNRFLFGGDMTLATNTSVTLRYDATSSRWRAITSPGSGGGGGGTVTSAAIAAGMGVVTSGTCTITTSGTCTVSSNWVAPQGRMTLQSGVATMTTTQSAKTVVYYTSYNGGKYVPIYNGSTINPYAICADGTAGTCELTLTLGSNWTANSNYDGFVGLNSSVVTFCTGPDWTAGTAGSRTVRGTGAGSTELERIDGLLTNKNSMTCRYGNASTFTCGVHQCTYVGTFGTNGSTGTVDWIYGATAAGGTAGSFNLWNMYNRVVVKTIVSDSNNSWTLAAVSTRSADNSTAMRVSFITGQADEFVYANYIGNCAGGGQCAQGVGLNTTSAFTGRRGYNSSSTNSLPVSGDDIASVLGFNYYQAIESSQISGTATFVGDAGIDYHQSGLLFRGRF